MTMQRHPAVPPASTSRWDARTSTVVASASGALPMLAIALMEPSFLRPGALPILTIVVAFTAVTVAIAVRAGRLTERQFATLGSGGMLGVAISAYLIADPAGTRAVTSMLAVVPALAASGSPPRVTAVLTAASVAMATGLSVAAPKSSGIAVTMIDVAAAVTVVLVPVVLILALRRSVTTTNRRLEVLANTDLLTGLYNRRGLLTAAKAQLRDTGGQRACFTAVVIDIDYFKAVNDSIGHLEGDRVLVAVARTLENAVDRIGESGSIIARIGGEEFFLLIPGGERPALGATIVDAVQSRGVVTVSAGSVTVEAVPTPDKTIHHSAPVQVNTRGEATTDRRCTRLDEDLRVERAVNSMVHAADRGLYAAKTAGRNRARHCGTLAVALCCNRPSQR